MKDKTLLLLKEVKERCAIKGIQVLYIENYVNRIIHGNAETVEKIRAEIIAIRLKIETEKVTKVYL